MKRSNLLAVLIAVPALLTFIGIGLHSTFAQDSAPKIERVKWEYKVEGRRGVNDMNDLGREGWELTGIIPQGGGTSELVYKRPIVNPR